MYSGRNDKVWGSWITLDKSGQQPTHRKSVDEYEWNDRQYDIP